MFIVLLDWTML